MKPQEKVMKSVMLSMDSVKDTLERNLLAAQKTGLFVLEPTELPKLLAILRSSVDEGFQKSYRVVEREVGAVFQENQESKKPQKQFKS